MWIEHGATKFYVYHDSFTEEVNGIFKIYENDPNISIARIPWGKLPATNSTSDTENLNNLLYSGGVNYTAVLYRSIYN